jgi:hypothetical protein
VGWGEGVPMHACPSLSNILESGEGSSPFRSPPFSSHRQQVDLQSDRELDCHGGPLHTCAFLMQVQLDVG